MTATRRHTRLPAGVGALVLAAVVLVAFAPLAHTAVLEGSQNEVEGRGAGPQIAQARQASAAFHRFDVAHTMGYRVLSDAEGIECIEHPVEGGMGIHLVNGDLVGDPQIDARRPEAVIYEPTRGGRLRLVAVEYVVLHDAWHQGNDAPPTLFGQPFTLVGEDNRYGLPAFYELHAWLWKSNPAGSFVDYNPLVTCPGAHPS